MLILYRSIASFNLMHFFLERKIKIHNSEYYILCFIENTLVHLQLSAIPWNLCWCAVKIYLKNLHDPYKCILNGNQETMAHTFRGLEHVHNCRNYYKGYSTWEICGAVPKPQKETSISLSFSGMLSLPYYWKLAEDGIWFSFQ